MIIQELTINNMFETRTYFYIDEKTKHGFLIDPGGDADKLLSLIKQQNWKIEKILLTHSHVDHIGAVEEISSHLSVPYLIHRSGKELLADPQYNLSKYFGSGIILNDAIIFDDGDNITLQSDSRIALKAIHTPGHTPDSSIFYDADNKLAFVGDTIFKASVGATHHPGGNEELLQRSIADKIFSLPPETVLYSGHTEKTTVAAEKSRYLI